MAFYIKNGKKKDFSPQTISLILSKVFSENTEVYKHRSLIIQLSSTIYNDLVSHYGSGDQIEIFEHNIHTYIKKHLPPEFNFLSNKFDLVENKNEITWKLKLNVDFHKSKVVIRLTREDWINFFEKFSINYIEKGYFFLFSSIKTILLKQKQNLVKTEEEWFEYFYDLIFAHLENDPRCLYFIQALRLRFNAAKYLKISWLPELSNIGEQYKGNEFLPSKPIEFILDSVDRNKIFKEVFVKKYQIDPKYVTKLDHIYEYKNGWLASHLFLKNDLDNFIQYTFLKVALSLSQDVDTVNKIYLALANKEIILPTQLLNILYHNSKNYHSYSSCLEDNYESIHNGLTDAIINTKWTGNVFLDFSKIRKANTPIRNGLRITNGISPYIHMLNEYIKSQGREKNDLPITVSLPIYHYEIFSLFLHIEKQDLIIKPEKFKDLSLKQEQEQIEKEDERIENYPDQLIRSIEISDYFMLKLINGDDWFVFDPYHCSQLGLDLDREEDYKKAEEMAKKGEITTRFYRKLKSNILFGRIIKYAKTNNISIIFSDFFKEQQQGKLLYGSGFVQNKSNKNYLINIGLSVKNGIQTDQLHLIVDLLKKYFSQEVHFSISILGIDEYCHKNKVSKSQYIYKIFRTIHKTQGEKFNEFVYKFNKHRQNIEVFKTMKDGHDVFDFSKEFNCSFNLSSNSELSYLGDLKESGIGNKNIFIEVIEKGKTRKIHTPTFLITYDQNITEHEIFKKVFFKTSPSYFRHYEVLKEFFPDLDYYNKELDFYSHYLPFYRQGTHVTVSKLLPENELHIIVNKLWLKGISNIRFI